MAHAATGMTTLKSSGRSANAASSGAKTKTKMPISRTVSPSSRSMAFCWLSPSPAFPVAITMHTRSHRPKVPSTGRICKRSRAIGTRLLRRLSALRGRGLADLLQDRDQFVHLRLTKHAFGSSRVDVRERRFVEARGIHDAVFGEVVDDQGDELDLMRGRRPARQELPECLLGGLAVHPDERPEEEAQAARLLLGADDVGGGADAGVHEHALELGEAAARQGLVPAQLVDRDVGFVLAQEHARLDTEALEAGACREAG